MKLHDWLKAEAGRATQMAAEFGVTLAAVSQWRATGAPVKYLRRIVMMTGDVVTVEELLDDIDARVAAQQDAADSAAAPTQA